MSRAFTTMGTAQRNVAFHPVRPPAQRSPVQAPPARGPAMSWPASDFSTIPVHSRAAGGGHATLSSAPTPQPAAPKPKPGEAKLGELEIEGVKEPIFSSFVPSGLWWLNGATPTLAQLYPQDAVLNLAQIGAGEFSLKITKGADKIKFDQGGTTLTGKDLAQAKVTSQAPSKKADDVQIEIQHREPQEKKLARVGTVDLSVRAPHHLDLLGTEHRAEGTNGYNSVTSLRVFDNLGEPMPFIDTNEDFTTGTLTPGTDKVLGESLATRNKGHTITRGNAVFQDNYRLSVTGDVKGVKPMPSNPRTPLGTTLIVTFEHDWFVGSGSTGKGVHVSHHVGHFYADHGEYSAFTSPVAGSGRGKPAAAASQKTAPAKPAPAVPAGQPGRVP